MLFRWPYTNLKADRTRWDIRYKVYNVPQIYFQNLFTAIANCMSMTWLRFLQSTRTLHFVVILVKSYCVTKFYQRERTTGVIKKPSCKFQKYYLKAKWNKSISNAAIFSQNSFGITQKNMTSLTNAFKLYSTWTGLILWLIGRTYICMVCVSYLGLK